MSTLKKYAVCIFIMVATTIGYSKGQEKNLETDFSFPEYNNNVLPKDSIKPLVKKYSINIGYSFPCLGSYSFPGQFLINTDPYIGALSLEALYWLGTNPTVNFGFGAGIKFNNHSWYEDYASVKQVNGEWIKYAGSDSYIFNFTDINLPLKAKLLINTKVINTLTGGMRIGYLVGTNFKKNDYSYLDKSEIDKFYLDFNVGFEMFAFRCGRATYSFQPFWSTCFYLSNKNELQKNYSSLGISLNSSF